MIKIEFPEPDFNIRKEGESILVFDRIRSKWVTLLPEEWVRQNIINWLIRHQNIPAAFIAVEQSIKINSLKKRCDILVYDREHKPWMMIEAKAQDVELDENVLTQILNYCRGIPVAFILIANGKDAYIANVSKADTPWLDEFPQFK